MRAFKHFLFAIVLATPALAFGQYVPPPGYGPDGIADTVYVDIAFGEWQSANTDLNNTLSDRLIRFSLTRPNGSTTWAGPIAVDAGEITSNGLVHKFGELLASGVSYDPADESWVVAGVRAVRLANADEGATLVIVDGLWTIQGDDGGGVITGISLQNSDAGPPHTHQWVDNDNWGPVTYTIWFRRDPAYPGAGGDNPPDDPGGPEEPEGPDDEDPNKPEPPNPDEDEDEEEDPPPEIPSTDLACIDALVDEITTALGLTELLADASASSTNYTIAFDINTGPALGVFEIRLPVAGDDTVKALRGWIKLLMKILLSVATIRGVLVTLRQY